MKRLPMRKIRDVLRLSAEGLSTRKIGVSLTPRVNLLPRNLVALRHLRHRCAANPDQHDDLELVLITPEAPPLHPKKFAPHHGPRIRHVIYDVVKHVS